METGRNRSSFWKLPLIITFGFCAAISILIGVALWQEATLKKILRSELKGQIQNSLPEGYQLTAFDLKFSWGHLLRLGEADLSLVVATPWFPVHVQTPVALPPLSNLVSQLFFENTMTQIKLKPQIWLQKPDNTEANITGQVLIEADLQAQSVQEIDFKANIHRLPYPIQLVDLTLQGKVLSPLEEMKVDLHATATQVAYESDGMKLKSESLKADLAFHNCQLKVLLPQHTVLYESEGFSFNFKPQLDYQLDSACDPALANGKAQLTLHEPNTELSASNLNVALKSTHHSFSHQALPPKSLELDSRFEQLEILWGDHYMDPEIKDYRLKIEAHSSANTNGETQIREVMSSLSKGERTVLDLRAQSENLLASEVAPEVTWNLKLDLQDLKPFLPPVSVQGWQWGGLLLSQGSVLLRSFTAPQFLKPTSLSLEKAYLVNPELRHQTQNAKMSLVVQSDQKAQFNLHLPDIRQLNFKAKLDQLKLPMVLSGQSLSIAPTEIPFSVEGLKLSLKPLSALFNWKENFSYSIQSGLRLPRTSLKKLSQNICLSPDITPKGTLQLDYPSIELSENQVATTGAGRLNVFSGHVDIHEFEIDQLLSPQPQTFISADWQNLQLERIGDFTQFGGMEGQASGHLKNVLFSGTLLKDYDFKFELQPLKGESRTYFSRKATRNLLEIFAQGQGFDQGPASLLLKLSSQILGDYGIDYAGLRVFTQNKFVILETFDPPSDNPLSTHFLLYGPRIKMPLSTQTYPIVMSKNGWNGFVYYFRDSLLALMNAPSDTDDSDSETPTETSPPPIENPTTEVPCFTPSLGQQS